MIDKAQVHSFLQQTLQFEGSEDQIQLLDKGNINLPDTTVKCVISNPAGSDYFMLVSAPNGTSGIARAVENIKKIKSLLPQDFAGTLLSPLSAGEINHRSCAVWALHEPFMPSSQMLFRLRRILYRRRFLDWAYDFCAHTLSTPSGQESLLSGFIRPLRQVMARETFPALMREHAKIAIQRIECKQWQPKHCVQHGDLWYGNILLPNKKYKNEANLYVIDWGSANMYGYPIFDFARLAIAMNSNRRVLRPYIDKFTQLLGCERPDISAYMLCAIGDMATKLEHFPEDQFHLMSIGTYEYIRNMSLGTNEKLPLAFLNASKA
ncbi:MAG TPA: phosphotransferase [Methylophilus sp.]|nr:phosphotransferase [Methylophilus sp.]HQQ32827.1 phosphotransferase [Methylophilus sp.]